MGNLLMNFDGKSSENNWRSVSAISCKTKKKSKEPFFLTAALVLLVMIAGGFFVSLLKMVVFVVQYWYIVLGTVLLLVFLKKTIFAVRDDTLPLHGGGFSITRSGRRAATRKTFSASPE